MGSGATSETGSGTVITRGSQTLQPGAQLRADRRPIDAPDPSIGPVGVCRFDDFQADLDIPRSVLSNRLAGLVESGIMERREYREEGQRRASNTL